VVATKLDLLRIGDRIGEKARENDHSLITSDDKTDRSTRAPAVRSSFG
jgi:hypothetical protein